MVQKTNWKTPEFFNNNKYFDVNVEYAKEGYNDLLMRLTVKNCSPHEAQIDVIAQLWFSGSVVTEGTSYLNIDKENPDKVIAEDPLLGCYTWITDSPDTLVFTNNTYIAKGAFHDHCKDGGIADVLAHQQQLGTSTGTKVSRNLNLFSLLKPIQANFVGGSAP